jgi:pilus assembly protein CpaE
MAEQINVVIIDADQKSRQLMMVLLSEIQQIKMVTEAVELEQGYELVKEHNPAIVILALAPTVDSALGLAEIIRRNFPGIALFATSAESTPEVIIKAMRAGAKEFLAQPLNKDEFVTAVNSVIRLESQRMAKGVKVENPDHIWRQGRRRYDHDCDESGSQPGRAYGKSVILVDLNLQLGNAALFLNMRPSTPLSM